MSDIGWHRLLYSGAGLSLLVAAILVIFVIPQVKNQPGMMHGSDWVFTGIQIFFAAVLYVIGNRASRDGCLPRVLLFFIGISAILLSLLGFMAFAKETEINLFWQAIRACAIGDLMVGIMAFYACL